MKEDRHESTHIMWLNLYEVPTNGKFIDTENRVMVTWDWGVGAETDYKQSWGNFWEWLEWFKTGLFDSCTTLHIYK